MIRVLLMLLFTTSLFASLDIAVSILPEKSFVERITKGKANIHVMVPKGNSPHNYEPKASQMKDLSKSTLYFSIGVEFENIWLSRFRSQNENLKVVDISKGIEKLHINKHSHHGEHDDHEDEKLDPHTWTTPSNIKIMAKNIYNELIKVDPINQKFYAKNLDVFLNELTDLDTKIREILKTVPKKSKFMVFHPSWGYFAHDYDLVQIAIEVDGKSPKPKTLIKIINEAKEERVTAIFSQKEFSQKSAKIIAKELNIDVIPISPLNPDFKQNLLKMANTIARK
jgi:zinc transport system substrate-binding protein